MKFFSKHEKLSCALLHESTVAGASLLWSCVTSSIHSSWNAGWHSQQTRRKVQSWSFSSDKQLLKRKVDFILSLCLPKEVWSEILYQNWKLKMWILASVTIHCKMEKKTNSLTKNKCTQKPSNIEWGDQEAPSLTSPTRLATHSNWSFTKKGFKKKRCITIYSKCLQITIKKMFNKLSSGGVQF